MKINAERSPDKRVRTEVYQITEGGRFSLAEVTAKGILITEFKMSGEVFNQTLKVTEDSFGALSEYLKERGELAILETPAYQPVKIAAVCSKCSSERIVRELDRRDTTKIEDIPVVPMFVCEKCGAKFYSMSDHYLRNLVENSTELFAPDELAERDKDTNKFVNTLQENIIRIFASKRISRLNIKG